MDEVNQATDGLLSLAGKLPELVTTFAGLGAPGWIAAGILLLLILVGGFFLVRWMKGQAAEKAARATEKHRQEAEAALPGQGQPLEDGLQAGEQALRDRLKGGP